MRIVTLRLPGSASGNRLVSTRRVPYKQGVISRCAPSSKVAVLVLGAATVVGTTATRVDAQPKTPPPAKAVRACSVAAIPLSVGNTWTYESVAPPPDRQLSEAQLKFTPLAAKKLTIEVKAIDTKDGVTTVTLSEDLDGRTHASSITCTAGGRFQIAANSFWWNGEPGTTFGIELSDVERKGQTLELTAGKITGLEWHDDMLGKWKHVATAKATPTMSTGTVSVVRHLAVQPAELVSTKAGSWKALKIGIESTIVVTIDRTTAKPLRDIPLMVNFLYQVDNVGIVEAINSFGQMYVLTAFTVN
jgi:hypothetical protein